MTQLPTDTFSLGEELSSSHVVHLAWSPPGVAPFRRCALAVLTSNLVLSIWGLEDGKTRWTRMAVVNEAVKPFLDPHVSGQEELQQRQRVRSFAWSPGANVVGSSMSLSSSLDPVERWGRQFLALGNDDGEVTVVEVQGGMRLRVHGQVRLEANARPIQSASRLARIVNDCRIVSEIVWSSWTEGRSYLGVLCAGLSVVQVTMGELLAMETLPLDAAMPGRFQEGLCWLDNENSEQLQLFAPVYGQPVYGLITPLPDHASVHLAQHSSLPSIDIVTGVVNVDNTVFVARHTDGLQSFPLSLGDDCPGLLAQLTDQITAQRLQFDLNYDLAGNSRARVWGMDRHPDVRSRRLAACFSLHPTDMIEQVIPSRARLRIVFTGEASSLIPHGELNVSDVQAARKQVLHFTMSWCGSRDGDHQRHEADDLFWKLQYTAACCALAEYEKDSDILALACLVMENLTLKYGSTVDLSREIELCTPAADSMALDQDRDDNNQTSSQHPRAIPPKHSTVHPGGGGAAPFVETCDICDAPIGWDSAVSACCASGHVFRRCGITFLALQDPGSKECGRCGTEYVGGEGEEGSLLRVLLETFDTCVYCGGKFEV